MTNLTHLLALPAARERVGWMVEQVNADRRRRRHLASWRQDSTSLDNGGCMFCTIGILGLVMYAALAAWMLF